VKRSSSEQAEATMASLQVTTDSLNAGAALISPSSGTISFDADAAAATPAAAAWSQLAGQAGQLHVQSTEAILGLGRSLTAAAQVYTIAEQSLTTEAGG
jgi:hypothetical protein